MYLWSFGKKLVRICLCHVLTNVCKHGAHVWGKGHWLITSPQNSRLLPLPLQLSRTPGLRLTLLCRSGIWNDFLQTQDAGSS